MPSHTSAIALPRALHHVNAVVRDLRKTTEFLSAMWGIGPWKTMDFEFTKDNIIVGEPCKLKIAHAKLGSTQLELIQPLEGRSVWSEFLKSKGEGLHHVAFTVPDWEETAAKIQKRGGKIIAAGSGYGQRFGYFDTTVGGILIEFEEMSKKGKPTPVPLDTTAIGLPTQMDHIGVVVRNIEKTTEFLSSMLGLGPWKLVDLSASKNDIARGDAVGEPFRVRLAFAKFGATELELLQPIEGKRFLSEFVEIKGEGLHHMAFRVPNYDEMVSKLEEHGGIVVGIGKYEGKRAVLMDTKLGGILIEFKEQ